MAKKKDADLTPEERAKAQREAELARRRIEPGPDVIPPKPVLVAGE